MIQVDCSPKLKIVHHIEAQRTAGEFHVGGGRRRKSRKHILQ
jgi:hypothetical protein